MSIASQNLTVTKSNDLNEASYKLTLSERRLILLCIAKLDSKGDVPRRLLITAEDYGDAFGLSQKNRYSQLREASDNLYDQDIRINNPERNESERFRWVDRIKYYHGNGSVEISFSSAVTPYISQLKSHFTTYKLSEIRQIKSGHTIRIYELLQQYLKLKKRTISVDDLRSYLELKGQYVKFADLRRSVIEPAVKDINRRTKLEVSWEPIKRGRFIHALKFSIQEKSQLDMFPV